MQRHYRPPVHNSRRTRRAENERKTFVNAVQILLSNPSDGPAQRIFWKHCPSAAFEALNKMGYGYHKTPPQNLLLRAIWDTKWTPIDNATSIDDAKVSESIDEILGDLKGLDFSSASTDTFDSVKTEVNTELISFVLDDDKAGINGPTGSEFKTNAETDFCDALNREQTLLLDLFADDQTAISDATSNKQRIVSLFDVESGGITCDANLSEQSSVSLLEAEFRTATCVATLREQSSVSLLEAELGTVICDATSREQNKAPFPNTDIPNIGSFHHVDHQAGHGDVLVFNNSNIQANYDAWSDNRPKASQKKTFISGIDLMKRYREWGL